MKGFETSDPVIGAARDQLAKAKKAGNAAEKEEKAAKATIIRWLKEERKYEIADQPAGTIVVIQFDGKDAIKLERKGRSGIDLERLRAEASEVAEKFATTSTATYFDVLG
jgi:hypothetical protein